MDFTDKIYKVQELINSDKVSLSDKKFYACGLKNLLSEYNCSNCMNSLRMTNNLRYCSFLQKVTNSNERDNSCPFNAVERDMNLIIKK